MIINIFVILLIVRGAFSQNLMLQCALDGEMMMMNSTCPTTVNPICGWKSPCNSLNCTMDFANECLACQNSTIDTIVKGECKTQDFTVEFCMDTDRNATCNSTSFDLIKDPVCGYYFDQVHQTTFGSRCHACNDPSILSTQKGYCYGFDGESLNNFYNIFEDMNRYYCTFPWDGQNMVKNCTNNLPQGGNVCAVLKPAKCPNPPCMQEYDSGCMACNQGNVSYYFQQSCNNTLMLNMSQYCTQAEKNNTQPCLTDNTPVCGTSFRFIYEDGEWMSGNGTPLPTNGSWKPLPGSWLPGNHSWIDGEWWGTEHKFANFMNNYQQHHYMNRCQACKAPNIDFVTDGECVTYIPIPVPVIVNIPTNGSSATTPGMSGMHGPVFSFCPTTMNSTACVTDPTNPTPVCGVRKDCIIDPAAGNCLSNYTSHCEACTKNDTGLVVSGNCVDDNSLFNSFASLFQSNNRTLRIKCVNRCTVCSPLQPNIPVCAFKATCPTGAPCFTTMGNSCMACMDTTNDFYYDGACENTLDNNVGEC